MADAFSFDIRSGESQGNSNIPASGNGGGTRKYKVDFMLLPKTEADWAKMQYKLAIV